MKERKSSNINCNDGDYNNNNTNNKANNNVYNNTNNNINTKGKKMSDFKRYFYKTLIALNIDYEGVPTWYSFHN